MAGVRFRMGGIMNSISIDIETFSSNDLSKCGVYKYVEAPDFDILLLPERDVIYTTSFWKKACLCKAKNGIKQI